MTRKEMENNIKDMIIERALAYSDIDIYRATSGIPKEGLKKLIVFDEFILNWIKDIINKKEVEDSLKVKVIEAILKKADKFCEGEGPDDKTCGKI